MVNDFGLWQTYVGNHTAACTRHNRAPTYPHYLNTFRIQVESQQSKADENRIRNSPLILYDFRRGVSYGTTRGLRDLVPDNLGKTKVRKLDESDTTTADSWPELALIFLFFIVRAVNRVL
jgi:hypothetical protein